MTCFAIVGYYIKYEDKIMHWNANYGEIPKPPLTQKWGNNVHTTLFYLVCVTWHIQLLNGFIHGV